MANWVKLTLAFLLLAFFVQMQKIEAIYLERGHKISGKRAVSGLRYFIKLQLVIFRE
jgi:hypothetical protein